MNDLGNDNMLHYRVLLDSMNDGFGVVDKDNRFTYVNKRFAKMLLYKVEEMLGKTLLDFLNEENKEILLKNIQKRTEGLPSQYELEWSRKDGTLLPSIVSGAPLEDEQGNHMGSFAVITDITERRKTERRLRENEERYRTLFEQTPIGLLTCNKYGKILNINETALEILGSPSKDATQQINLLSYQPLVDAGISEDFRRCINRVFTVFGECEYTSKWGKYTYLHYRINPIIDESGEIVEVLGAFDDISSTKRAEDALRESEEKYRTLTEKSLQGLSVIQNERYVYVNAAFASMLGYTVDEIMGMSGDEQWEMIHPEDRPMLLNLAEARRRRQETPTRYEYRFITSTGSIRWVEAHSSIIEFDGEEALQVLAIDITERKSAESALRKSEERFRRIFEESPIGIEIFNREGTLLEANRATLSIAGLTDIEQLRGYNIFKDDQLPEYVSEALKRGEGVRYIAPLDFSKQDQYPTTRNDIIYIDVVVTPLGFDSTGDSRGFLIQLQDITERRNTEAKLRESQRMLQLVINTIPQHIFWKDKSSVYIGCNDKFAEVAGLDSAEEIVGKTDYDLSWSKEQADSNIEIDQRILSTGNPEYHLVEPQFQADGKRAWMDITKVPLKSESDEVIGILGLYEDITKRKESEDAIRNSEEKYRSLAEQSLQGLTILKPEGLVYVNKTFCRFIGYTEEELLDMSPEQVRNLIHPDDQDVLDRRIDARKDGRRTAPSYEYRLVRKDGDIRWVEAYASVIDYMGEPAVQTVLVDVTERREAEKQVRVSKDRAMLYLDLMGHDIRNQLQVIQNSASLLRTATSPDVQDYFLDVIAKAVGRCSRMIGEVKETEQLMNAPTVQRDLLTSVRGVVQAISAVSEDSKFNLAIKVDNALVQADEYLELLVSNVIANAIEHNPKDDKQVWVEITETVDGYFVSVADNGKGIPDGRKDDLFDMARRYGGIGLHQSQQILDKYGGRIEVEDRVKGNHSEGAMFKIWLPKPPRSITE